jgi:hypothetical protein
MTIQQDRVTQNTASSDTYNQISRVLRSSNKKSLLSAAPGCELEISMVEGESRVACEFSTVCVIDRELRVMLRIIVSEEQISVLFLLRLYRLWVLWSTF